MTKINNGVSWVCVILHVFVVSCSCRVVVLYAIGSVFFCARAMALGNVQLVRCCCGVVAVCGGCLVYELPYSSTECGVSNSSKYCLVLAGGV